MSDRMQQNGRRNRRTRNLLTLFVFVLLIVYSFLLMEQNIGPVILDIAKVRITQSATRAIAETIAGTMGMGVRYEDLVDVRMNQQGEVSLLQANVVEANRISARVLKGVEQSIEKLTQQKISIPMGQALGSMLLSGVGPTIDAWVTPVGYAKTELHDEFKSAGVNMTHHIIRLFIVAKLRIVIPFRSSEVEVRNEVMLADGIIAGKVPSVIAGNGVFGIPGSDSR